MSGIKDKLLVLFVVPLFLYVLILAVMPLMEPDEARYSLIPHEMNSSGDYVTPRLKGVVYLEKPPLAYWATALSFRIFGENDFSSRLFTGLCGWGCLLLVYAMGKSFHDEKTGLYGAAVLATSLFHFAISRINILDMPVAFFMSLAIWAGYRSRSKGEKKSWIYLFYLACALAFLTKGLIGFVLPVGVLVVWLLAAGRWREIPRLLSPLGILVFLAVALPWVILVQRANPDFLWFFFVHEHFQRYTTTVHQHGEPVYYYLLVLAVGIMPWFAFLFPASGRNGAGREKRLFSKEESLFLLTWAGLILLFFSFSSSKLVPYIAPVFLPVALFLGAIFRFADEQPARPGEGIVTLSTVPIFIQSLLFIALLAAPAFIDKHQVPLAEWWPWIILPLVFQVLLIVLPGYVRQKSGRHWFLTAYMVMALFFATLVFPLARFLTPYKSAYPLVPAIKEYLPAGEELYQYGMCLYGVDYYNGIRTPIVDEPGELLFGSKYLSPAERQHYFLNDRTFLDLCRQRRVTYCITKKRDNLERLRAAGFQITVLWDNGYYYLLKVNNENT